ALVLRDDDGYDRAGVAAAQVARDVAPPGDDLLDRAHPLSAHGADRLLHHLVTHGAHPRPSRRPAGPAVREERPPAAVGAGRPRAGARSPPAPRRTAPRRSRRSPTGGSRRGAAHPRRRSRSPRRGGSRRRSPPGPGAGPRSP